MTQDLINALKALVDTFATVIPQGIVVTLPVVPVVQQTIKFVPGQPPVIVNDSDDNGPIGTVVTNVTAVNVAVGSVSVSFTAPTFSDGSAVSSYTVTSNAGQVATGTSSPVVVSGLTPGVAYTFTVTASSTTGKVTAPSVASLAVTAV